MNRHKKQYSFEEVLSKLMRYCAYQERSPKEVREKASKLGSSEEEQEELLNKLIAENFVDESRFAELYVRGKVRLKKWGKYKLIEGLKTKGISESEIEKSINQITEEEYIINLDYLIESRLPIDETDKNELAKLYRYLLSRGYESALVVSCLKKRNLM